MKIRKILYGYQIQQGELVIQPHEALVVKRIVSAYLNGLAYQKISDTLNAGKVPYSDESPAWNKHKVKRLLENARYTGTDGYPAVIEEDLFQTVQARIREKTANSVPAEERPALLLKKYMRCACGNPLYRLTGKSHIKDCLALKCRACGKQFVIKDAELLQEAARQLEGHYENAAGYNPSSEVIRLENAVNRSLEHPDTPEDVLSLILQGVAARYDCCPEPIEDFTCLMEADLKRFCQVVSYITISDKNTMTVYFK